MELVKDDDLNRLEEAYLASTQGDWKLGDCRVYVKDPCDAGKHRFHLTVFAPYSPRTRHQDCAFAAVAHELTPALIAEIRRLRSHLNPPVGASGTSDGPTVQEAIKCPSCGSTGPLTKVCYVLANRESTTYTCGCGEHFQPDA